MPPASCWPTLRAMLLACWRSGSFRVRSMHRAHRVPAIVRLAKVLGGPAGEQALRRRAQKISDNLGTIGTALGALVLQALHYSQGFECFSATAPNLWMPTVYASVVEIFRGDGSIRGGVPHRRAWQQGRGNRTPCGSASAGSAQPCTWSEIRFSSRLYHGAEQNDPAALATRP